MPDIDNIVLYRIVHWQNVEYILRNGLYYQNHSMADPDYINIGHKQLISDRQTYPITKLPNAGFLGEYIPFYFGPHSPMLLMIRNGTPPVEQRPQEDIVYIISKVPAIQAAGLEYCFTDMHAKIKLAGYYREDTDFDKIDWETVNAKNWSKTPEDMGRQDRKQAEFLVRYHVPVSCISWLGVKTQARKEYFEEMITNLGLAIQVFVDPGNQLYY